MWSLYLESLGNILLYETSVVTLKIVDCKEITDVYFAQ